MSFKFFFPALLSISTSCVLASETLGVGEPPEAKPIATQQDINTLKSLINKGFSLQTAAIEDKGAALNQLKKQGDALGEAMQSIEAQQSIAVNNLRFIAGALSVFSFLQIVTFGLLNKRQRKSLPSPMPSDINNANKGDMTELSAKLTPDNVPASVMTKSTADDTIATNASANPAVGSGVLISSVKIEKASLLFEEFLRPQDSNGSNSSISTLLAQSKKIKINGLEKLNNPKPYSSPTPLRLAIKPITTLGNRRSLATALIRNKIFSTRKIV